MLTVPSTGSSRAYVTPHDIVTGQTDRMKDAVPAGSALTGVGRQLIAGLRSDGTASSHAAREEAARRNRGR